MGYLSLKTALSENSLILSLTLSKRITRITETFFLSPVLKANLDIVLNLREQILSFHFLLCQCMLPVGDLLQLGTAKRRLKWFQLPARSSARKQNSKRTVYFGQS